MTSGFKKNTYMMLLSGLGVGLGIFLMGFIPKGKIYWILSPIFLVGLMTPIIDGPIGLATARPVSDAFGIQIWFITAGILIFTSMVFGFFNKPLMNMDQGPDQVP